MTGLRRVPPHKGRLRRASLALGALLLVGLLGSPAGSAHDTPKRYSAAISPPAAAGGSSTVFSVTITNKAGSKLGSLNLTAPAGFTITGASLGGAGTIQPPVGPSVLKLRNLFLSPGATLSFSVTAAVPCTPGVYSWVTKAKQGGGFTGDEFTTTSVLTTSVSACRLAFVQQPAGAEVGAILTSAIYDPAGPPVTVAAVDGDGNVIPSATGDVTVTLAPTPSALSGTTIRALLGGVATFSDLRVGVTGRSFALTAASPGYSGAVSNDFPIVTAGFVCTGTGPCEGEAEDDGTTTSVSASDLASATTGLGIIVSANAAFPAGVCGSFTPLGSGSTIDIRPLPGLTLITVRLDKDLVNAKPTPNGAAHFDLCVGTNLPFPTKDGKPNFFDGTRFWGLAPNCTKKITGPCVKKRNKNYAGDVIVVGAVPAPYDPDWWAG